MNVIPIQNKIHRNGFPYKDLKGKYCLSPFVMIEITTDGRIRLCGCNSWMPRTVGNLNEQSLIEILSSEPARQVRKSIIDGTYIWCNEKNCGIMANDQLNDIDNVPEDIKPLLDDPKKFNLPHYISMAGDDTCNLSCPSCRTTIKKSNESEKDFRQMLGRTIAKNLFSHVTDQPITLHLSTSGEVFASELLLNFLSSISLSKMPNFQLHLQTNGLLASKKWHHIQHLERAIQCITISIDAAKAETYENVRRGGKWKSLLSAMKFLYLKKSQLGFEFRTRMVVQNQNYQEIEAFYEFSQSFGADKIEYARITDWGTWSPQEFQIHDVFDKQHPCHELVLTKIEQVKKLPGVWCHGMT